ncbi:DUF4440 domain-containing protein [Halovenus halobia]|uniref:DUF4440 domain-containing protein n=1 Tax=Halovenus halobia TaxID=3396622 RepID=UPI003F56A076
MLSTADCEREIRELHDCFVELYTGLREDIERVEQALGPDFRLVHPSGERSDRETVLDGIRSQKDSYGPSEFDIEIRNVDAIEVREDRALVSYEEWQTTPDEQTGRLSTAYFVPSERVAAEWRYLQETWL